MRSLGIALALIAGVLAIYGQTLGFDFVAFDDDLYVTRNTYVREGLTPEGIRFAFSERGDYLGGGFPPHPLTWLSLMLDAELFGDHPAGFHAMSTLLHALAAALLFAALQALTGAAWLSAVAAALWAWHPLRVESVAWVSERKDVLSGVFAMLTLWGYARGVRRGSQRARRGALLCFALGLLAKPTLVPLPFALVLLDYWPLARSQRLARLLLEKWPYFALALLASLFTLQSLRHWMVTPEFVSAGERAANAVVATATYLARFLWPHDLAVFYPHPYIQTAGGVPLGGATILASALLLAGLTLAVLWARRLPVLAVGWLWFLGMLVPTLGLVQAGHQALADRYSYLPSIGLGFAIVWGGGALATRVPALRRPLVALAAVALVALAGAAFAQARTWRDSETLFRHTLRVSPRASNIHYNLGDWLRIHGRVDEAIGHYRIAVGLDSGNPHLRFAFGRALHARGEVAEAIEAYRLAARLDPENGEYRYQLGLTYEILGRYAEAAHEYRAAAELAPDNPKPRERLAITLQKLRGR
jgi:tetratricopeptide (TPR) repeat protein